MERDTEARGIDPEGEVALPWHETGEREFKDIVSTSVIVLLLALAAVGLYNALRGVPGSQLGSAVLAIVLVVLAVLTWYGPFGSVGSRASVDHDGLWIRHQGWTLPGGTHIELLIPRHLPAAEIGTIEAVSEEKRRQMWTKSMPLRYRGRKLGWTRTVVDKETIEAVMIEQLDQRLRRPWWLVKCQQRDELIQALELARAAAGSTIGPRGEAGPSDP